MSPATPLPSPPPAPTPNPTPNPAPLPAVFLNGPSSATVGDQVTFSVSSSATGVTWNWSFGDDSGPVSTTAFSTTHAYASPGAFPVGVSSPTTSGASAMITVNPRSVAPTPNAFAATLTCTAGTTSAATTCNVSATYKGTAIQSSQITGVEFDWGNGNLNNNKMPFGSYTYPQAGTYVVVARVSANAPDGTSGIVVVTTQVLICNTKNAAGTACAS
jgi:PKD domain